MELISASRKARATGTRRVIFHADDAWLARINSGEFPIFEQIKSALLAKSVACQLMKHGSKPADLALADPVAAHIMLGGPALFGPRILHLSQAPIWGFWYLDELGVGWQSSLRLSEFDSHLIDEERATYFFNGVSGYVLRENVSLEPQEHRMHGALQGAKATVFCQAQDRDTADAAYLTAEEMIRTAAEFDTTSTIYVKLSLDQSKDERRHVMAVTQDYPNVKLSEASVHDLVEASDLVITQNAAAGFEALMQKCPVITCAKSPYWHATLTAKTRADLREALEYGTLAMFDFPYEKYFYWSLVKHGFEPAKDVFAKRFLARLYDKTMWR